MEDLSRPIERLNKQISILGEKIRGTQSIVPSDEGSSFKSEEPLNLTYKEKRREQQKAIEFGKALGIGRFEPRGKLEDLTPDIIKPAVAASPVMGKQDTGLGILGVVGGILKLGINLLSLVSLYKLLRNVFGEGKAKGVFNFLDKFFNPIIKFIDDLKERILNWFKTTFPRTYDFLKNIYDTIKGFFISIWEGIKSFSKMVVDFFKSDDKVGFIKDKWKMLKETVGEWFEGISTWFTGEGRTEGIFSTIIRSIKEFYEESVKPSFSSIIAGLSDWFNNIYTTTIEPSLGGMVNDIKTWVSENLNYLKEWINTKLEEWGVFEFFEKIKTTVNNIIDSFLPDIKRQINDILASARSAIGEIMGYVRSIAGDVSVAASNAAQITEDVKGTAAKIKEYTEDPGKLVKDTAKTIIKAVPGGETALDLYSTGKSVVEKGKKTVKEGVEKLKGIFGLDDYLVRGDKIIGFSNEDDVLGFKAGGAIDKVLGKQNTEMVGYTKNILQASIEQVSLLRRIEANTSNTNILLNTMRSGVKQRDTMNMPDTSIKTFFKFDRSEFDRQTSPEYNLKLA